MMLYLFTFIFFFLAIYLEISFVATIMDLYIKHIYLINSEEKVEGLMVDFYL